ncbi:hypothetical protein F7Q99_33755 [Streptomyces kaniharaensis]|uniref:Uncharacterized protein n=1 Tax=Streptomyces kaniharaensis TaxID=212423 RepID=A0A6N7L483_9ACTN|nr:hypothetical protein [Streptomyces kaniharaensis]MQS17024.1 hypothetical protein [Streptomyces kaniharaensis]
MPLFLSGARAPSHRAIQIGYAVAGAYFGWRWAFVEHGPVWERAARVLAQMAVLSTLVQLARWRRRRRTGTVGPLRLPLRSLLLGKLALVVLAAGAGLLLARWTSEAQLIAGAGLFLAIALGGPALHRRHDAASPQSLSPARPDRRLP